MAHLGFKSMQVVSRGSDLIYYNSYQVKKIKKYFWLVKRQNKWSKHPWTDKRKFYRRSQRDHIQIVKIKASLWM